MFDETTGHMQIKCRPYARQNNDGNVLGRNRFMQIKRRPYASQNNGGNVLGTHRTYVDLVQAIRQKEEWWKCLRNPQDICRLTAGHMLDRTMVEMSEEPTGHMQIKCKPFTRQNNGLNV